MIRALRPDVASRIRRRWRRGGRTYGRSLLAALAVIITVASLAQVVFLQSAPHNARALAAASTGTGGNYVALQAPLVNTTTGLGGFPSPLPASTWETIAVNGQAGLPSTGISAVELTITAVSPSSSGVISVRRASTIASVTALVYGFGTTGSVSNTAIVAVSSSGTIDLQTQTAIDVRVDVQGYYTAGAPDSGGYVPVTPNRLVNTANGTGLPASGKLSAGSNTTVQASGTAGIPAGASAVFVNFQVSSATTSGYLVAYDTGGTVPDTTLNYMPSVTTAIGATVPLSASGQFTIHVGGSSSIDLSADVVGYFTANTGTGAFTPAATRLIDSNAAPAAPIPANGTLTVQVAGVNGVPAAGAGVASVAVNVHIRHTGTASGYDVIWPADRTEPTTSSLTYSPSSTTSNLYTVALSAGGAIKIHNVSSDSVGYAIDLEGWYTSVASAVPNDQEQTQQSITLQANPAGGGSWVTYKYRIGTIANFANVPVANVKDGNGAAPSGWPVQQSNGVFTAYTWNVRDALKSALNVATAPDALVQVEACYGTSSTDANLACGMPSNIQFAQSAFGDGYATDSIGPGAVAKLTGDYELKETDAGVVSSLGGSGVGRVLTTLVPADAGVATGSQRSDASGVFGPGWTADLLGPNAGAGDLTVTDKASSGYLTFTQPDGGTVDYQAITPVTSYPITFAGVGDAASDGTTVAKVDATTITMAGSDGTVTTWTKAASGWQATTVQEPGSNSTSSYTYNSSGSVTRILAAVPSGVSCSTPDTTPGCRSLVLTYQTLAVSGINVTRLQEVDVSIPQTAGTTNKIPVAKYDYTAGGLLADAYDPRISPALKTAYTYNSAGRLATLTPPGQAAFTFGYDGSSRLSTISRLQPSGSTAVTTIVYDVPTTGTSAPTSLSASTTGTWDQVDDLPVTGTAVFGPDHKPAGTTPSTVTSTDWPYAAVSYLDVNGREVNTAAYGAGAWQIDTTEYDAAGNDVWSLSAGNRAQALTPTSDTDPYVAGLTSNVDRAGLLASTAVYNPLDPSEVTDTYGPTHPVLLDDRSSAIDARTHVATTYDEGAPNGGINPSTNGAYRLPTTVVSGPYNARSSADVGYPDAETTHIGYSAIVTGDTDGWSLGQPTKSAVQMAASTSTADLTAMTRYDSAGRAIETRLPGDAAGTTPRTTITSYYTATGTGPCVSPTAAGLLCTTAPAAQPSTGKPMPSTRYTYDQYGNTGTKTETYGSGTTAVVRTTTTSYDSGERLATNAITVSPASAGGTALPTVTYGYASTTGLATTVNNGTVTLTTGYDNLGRPTDYTDATGNTATTTYDIDGRPANVNDGKGITTYTYDSTSEHRGVITSENVGITGAPATFGASYDASGSLAVETYPNGLTATSAHDNAGNATKLTYQKSGSTWMTFTTTNGSQDRTVGTTSPQSSQNFGYDQDGRLTTVQDTFNNSCTTRRYTFDTHSNRTSLDSYAAGSGGACSSSTTATTATSSYDQADRATNTGYTYDDLGRTLTVPAADAHGIAAHATDTGTLTLGYYANDMAASQSQGSATVSFTVDPLQNRVRTETDGSTTTTNHYSSTSDSPAWSSTSTSSWTRNIAGPDGGLTLTVNQAGIATLQLANLHGDIVATSADDTTATGIATYSESTEYGSPRNASSAFTTYGWLGSEQRSSQALGGLTLMGVRLYNPQTGRFLSVDPVPSGNANGYIYPTDPVNMTDLSGMCGAWGNPFKKCGPERILMWSRGYNEYWQIIRTGIQGRYNGRGYYGIEHIVAGHVGAGKRDYWSNKSDMLHDVKAALVSANSVWTDYNHGVAGNYTITYTYRKRVRTSWWCGCTELREYEVYVIYFTAVQIGGLPLGVKTAWLKRHGRVGP